MSVIEVVALGIGGSVRDGGRLGLAHVGRGRGGAVDLASLELGNRLVGNRPGAGAFETSGGLTIRTTRPVMIAVTGSPCDLAVEDGPPVGWGAPCVVPAGATVRIGRLRGGARTYLCVRGGVTAGPHGVTVGPDPGGPVATQPAAPWPLDDPIRVWPGPRVDWFAAGSLERLTSTTWEVSVTSDRVGLRLQGPPLERVRTEELASEGMVEGAIQVPPDGHPIVMLADHPVTGGYPVIAVVDPADLRLVAQRPAGSSIRFARTR